MEEKRAECLKLKTQLQEMDDKYFDSQAKTKEELGRALRVRTECADYMRHFWEYCYSTHRKIFEIDKNERNRRNLRVENKRTVDDPWPTRRRGSS